MRYFDQGLTFVFLLFKDTICKRISFNFSIIFFKETFLTRPSILDLENPISSSSFKIHFYDVLLKDKHTHHIVLISFLVKLIYHLDCILQQLVLHAVFFFLYVEIIWFLLLLNVVQVNDLIYLNDYFLRIFILIISVVIKVF